MGLFNPIKIRERTDIVSICSDVQFIYYILINLKNVYPILIRFI